MQKTFSEAEYAGKKKLTRRDRFLNEIDQLAPWALLEAQIAPFYADNTGKRGRPSIGLSRMLRLYVVQQCFGLSDEGTEDAVYDSQAIRLFVGIDLSHESAPDATTLLNFRRLLETHQLTQKLFGAEVKAKSVANNLPILFVLACVMLFQILCSLSINDKYENSSNQESW